jgi:hypothetical protein
MALKITHSYLEDSIAVLRHYKGLAERAMAQVADEQLFTELDRESNSIAITVKHMAGNMRSQPRFGIRRAASDTHGVDGDLGRGMGLRPHIA